MVVYEFTEFTNSLVGKVMDRIINSLVGIYNNIWVWVKIRYPKIMDG